MRPCWHALWAASGWLILACLWICLIPIETPNAVATAIAATLPSKAELAQLPPDGGPHYNRLVFEQTPYLLQHATHPVDWYPWGQAAFDKAQREDKPVFLSIGYSTCHWCHVMARESFADVEVARLMSQYVVAVKVDREERPDIDHLGFGFHRYTTDAAWRLPHFEKMLCDQAMLLMVYTEAYQATGKTLYAQTAREIATYVLRDMTSPEGGFYSAQGAESAGQEGLFYLWTAAELQMALRPDDATLFMDMFHIAPAGNLPDATWRYRNLPRMTEDLATIAARHGRSETALRQRLERIRQQLFARRKARPAPFKDDKVLTDPRAMQPRG